MQIETRIARRSVVTALVLGALVVIAATLTLVGWSANWRPLTDWLGLGVSQLPNTALGALSLGLGVIALARRHLRSTSAFGGFAALIGAATLFEHLTQVNLGIDQLLFPRPWGQLGTLSPGRMGVPGCTSLLLLGAGLVASVSPRVRRWGVATGFVVIAISTLSLLGHLFGAPALFALPRLTLVAFQSSAMFFLLGLGLVLALPIHRPMRWLTEDSATAVMLRRLLPGVVIVPVALGWLSLMAVRSQLANPAFATALLVLSLTVVLVLVLFWAAREVHAFELQLASTSSRLAAVIGSITDTFLTVDRDWKVTQFNEAAATTLRTTPDQLLAKTLWDVLPWRADAPDYGHLREAMATRQTTQYEGHIDDLGRSFHTRAYPTADGGLAIYAQDITERARAEAQLRESQQHLQMALSLGRAATWDLNLVTGENRWSDSHFTMLGMTPPADRLAPPLLWQSAIMAEDLPSVLAAWQEAENTHSLFQSEHRMRRHDNGEVLYARATGQFFYDSTGRPIRFVGVFIDTTEHRRLETELVRLATSLSDADRRKNDFLATLAHELRNPLAPIRTGIELLKRVGHEPAVTSAALESMERQMLQLVRLTDDLLDLSRIARDKLLLRSAPLDLRQVITQAVESCQPAITAAHQKLTVSLPKEPVSLDGDRARLTQVVTNLLTNANKFTPPNGQLWVELEAGPQTAEIRVRDTGAGLRTEAIPHLFEMFAQGSTPLSNNQQGLGIGLALVKRLVEQHGGSVTARSGGPGQGSEFVVRLPRGLVATFVEDMPSPVAEMAPHRILVVDDNVDAADGLVLFLRTSGHFAEVAYDGSSALTVAERFRPQVVLSDIAMPDMDGYELCRRLREVPWGARMLIVALTGFGREEDISKALRAGFDAHFVKPVAYDDLLLNLHYRLNAQRLASDESG